MDPWKPAPKQRLLGSKGNTSSVSTQLPGQPGASPKVVISRASRHQVVDAHRARLPDAVHPVLGLHQHLRGGDRDACRSRLEAAQPTNSRWPLAPEPHHNPSSSLRVTWQGACKPLSTNGLSSDKREKQAQYWSAEGASICSWVAVDDPSGPGQLLGAADGEPASALPPAVTKEARHTATLPPWNEKLSSKQIEIPRPGRGHM